MGLVNIGDEKVARVIARRVLIQQGVLDYEFPDGCGQVTDIEVTSTAEDAMDGQQACNSNHGVLQAAACLIGKAVTDKRKSPSGSSQKGEVSFLRERHKYELPSEACFCVSLSPSHLCLGSVLCLPRG